MAIQVNLKETDTNQDDEHTSKRIKRQEEEIQSKNEEINPTIFSSTDILQSSATTLKLQHDQSTPYRHAVLKNLFNEEILKKARDEIKKTLSFTLKETDIYKVFQTGDLANLDGLSAHESLKLTHIKKVRDALYSQEFRNFLNQVTSCGPLSGKQTDMSINNYSQGCHLLNHDDVIGTRRVSYILYLTDPHVPWEADDGGALELYPVDPESNQLSSTPSTKILPSWNQFVFFLVQPGKSFHSVEEVFNSKKSRLSISGWFHLPNQDELGYSEAIRIKQSEEKSLKTLGASLDQLKSKSDHGPGWVNLNPQLDIEPSSLTPDEIKYLSQYMDSSFLIPKDIYRLQETFVAESCLSLIGFLNYNFSCKLKQSILENEAEDLLNLIKNKSSLSSSIYTKEFNGPRFELGLQDENWEILGPPHKHRYLIPSKHNTTNPSSAKSHLLKLKQLFESDTFAKWLRLLTSCIPTSHQVVPRRFRPGLDYTLATSNDSQLLEIHLSLTPTLGWDDGELGGWDCYMSPNDEDDEDPAVYKTSNHDDSTLLTLHPAWNKFDLVLRDPNVLSFSKYVSFSSTHSKWDVLSCYQIHQI